MASRIRVENLPPDLTEQGLKDIFAQIGEVDSVSILDSPDSISTGVVEMALDLDAYRAVRCLEGATLKDRKIHLIHLVESGPASPRPPTAFEPHHAIMSA